MADYRLNGLFWSIGFCIGGVLLLLFNFGRLAAYEPWIQYLLAGILAVVGVVFIVAFLSARQNWWRLIPGWTLLALAGMVYLSTWPDVGAQLSAALLFVGLAFAFAHVYLLDRGEHWWAIIPSGFMLVLGCVIGLSRTLTNLEVLAALLFVGMGAVFFLLYLLGDKRRHWWALIPGGVLALFGLFIFASGERGPNTELRWWPVLLIVIGIGFGITALRRPSPQPLMVNQAPRLPRARRLPDLPATLPNKSSTAPAKTISNSSTEYTRPAPGASVEILPDPDE